jgi:16S rRNA (guanine527-N7)-methyltransferase
MRITHNAVYPARIACMTSTIQPLLRLGAAELGITLTDAQVQQFETYHHLLVEWNERFNLTAITGYEDVQTKHFLDSLAGYKVLADAMARGRQGVPFSLCDVGTGAGFPGIPLRIVLPNLRLTLVDGTAKKISFLEHVCRELALEDVTFVQGRAEEMGQQAEWRAQFAVVTARAVAQLNTLAEYLLPLVKRDGYAILYKGSNAAQEVAEAEKAISLLGGGAATITPVKVPYLDESRHLVVIQKIRATPVQYPRGQGLARKSPLV